MSISSLLAAISRKLCHAAFFAVLALPVVATAQSRKIYLSPIVSAGVTSGYTYKNGGGLDMGNPDKFFRGELRAGYYLNHRVSLFTGFGFGAYHYRMLTPPLSSGPDTVRLQSQQSFEIPLGVRFATYHGRRNFRTRYYGGVGIAGCILNDERHDWHTADLAVYGSGQNEADFNRFYVRGFVEGGLDIPMDFESAILIGFWLSNGISRNMSADGALSKSNYGILSGALTFGLRFGL